MDADPQVAEVRAERDFFADTQTYLRAINPCAKLVALVVFVVCVVSSGKYEFARLLPFCALPIFCCAVFGVRVSETFVKAFPALVFAAAAGIANVFFDTRASFDFPPVTFGMLSFSSLLLKAYLCVSAALFFARCTPPDEIAGALGRFKLPCVAVVQLMLTARYIETVSEEAARMRRAYALRAPEKRAIEMRHFPHILTSLFLRTLGRAQNIYAAMQCAGFDARVYGGRVGALRLSDAVFAAAFSGCCLFARFVDIPELIESMFV